MPPATGRKVKLDKQRTLRFTTPAVVKLEAETGLTVDQIVRQCAEGSVTHLMRILWAGLLHADPDLSFENAVELVPMRGFKDAAKEAFMQFKDDMQMGKPDDEEEDAEGNGEGDTKE